MVLHLFSHCLPQWQVKAWVEKLVAVCQQTITGHVDVAMGAWVEKIGSEMLNDKGPLKLGRLPRFRQLEA